jgi:hypothetical protein
MSGAKVDHRLAKPVPLSRDEIEELRKRPSDALTHARISAGQMAWLLELALEHGELKE